jgi:hypothetical protein
MGMPSAGMTMRPAGLGATRTGLRNFRTVVAIPTPGMAIPRGGIGGLRTGIGLFRTIAEKREDRMGKWRTVGIMPRRGSATPGLLAHPPAGAAANRPHRTAE